MCPIYPDRKSAGWGRDAEGDTVKCDAYGCHTVSFLEAAALTLSVESIRVRLAIEGWRSAGDEGQLDFCPRHN